MAFGEPIGGAVANTGIESVPFDDGVLVHHPVTGALGLLNRARVIF
jgi:hypothetical protein